MYNLLCNAFQLWALVSVPTRFCKTFDNKFTSNLEKDITFLIMETFVMHQNRKWNFFSLSSHLVKMSDGSNNNFDGSFKFDYKLVSMYLMLGHSIICGEPLVFSIKCLSPILLKQTKLLLHPPPAPDYEITCPVGL
jgi:hypothetical protein